MRKTNRSKTNIIQSIEQWLRMSAYKTPILNRISQLIPFFVLWKLWKESNRKIFHSKSTTLDFVFSKIFSNIQETVISQHWSVKDLNCNPNENIILSKWHLNISMSSYHSNFGNQTTTLQISNSWKFHPPGFFMLNFHGSSKGNPGPAGFRVVIRNSDGIINHILAKNLGFDTNKSV